jgi:diguanylate cyclase (GGDEF)-like protein
VIAAQWIRRLIPHSIVARTTLSIIALSLLLGLTFASVAYVRAQQNEETRLQVGLQDLLSAVETTAGIACFLNDKALAREIARGLLKNHSVSAVWIVAGGQTLYQSPAMMTAVTNKVRTRVISRTLYSPFDSTAIVGEIALYPSEAEITAQARRYSRGILIMLGLEVLLVGAGVAGVAYGLVTRPISAISEDLHGLQMDTGMQLPIPRGNRSNEIGQLVFDVNSLIRRLTSALKDERALRVEHEVQQRMMALIIDKAQTGIFIVNSRGVVQSRNPAFEHILGVDPTFTGARELQLEGLLAPSGGEVAGLIARALETGVPSDVDLEICRTGAPDSAWVAFSLHSIGPDTLHGVVNDITERKRLELSSRRLAAHDELTGLLNRRGLEAKLKELFQQPLTRRMRLAIVQVDLDLFKAVNDTRGHAAGDMVLKAVACILREVIRRSDFVGRPGGDEFVAILVDVEGPAAAREIAERMLARIQQPIDLGGGAVARISASIGIAFPRTGDQEGDLRQRADDVMYEAKRSGGARVRLAPHVVDVERLNDRGRGPRGVGEDR